MKFLLFIPCYNCAPQIPRIIGQLTADIQRHIHTVLLVDNRSSDDTIESAKAAIKQQSSASKFLIFKNEENYSLGGSHKVAFDFAIKNKFDFVGVLHGDDQANIDDFKQEINNLCESSDDCILGSRFMDLTKLEGYSWFRIYGNRVFNFLFSMVLGKKIRDLGSGLNIFRVEALKKFRYILLPDDLTFNYGLSAVMVFTGLKIRYVPISWREQDQVTNVRLMRQTLQLCKMIGRIVLNGRKFVDIDLRERKRHDYQSGPID